MSNITEESKKYLKKYVETKNIRYRINVSVSVKGIKTYDCTVDAEGCEMEDVIIASDLLVKVLDAKYDPVIQAQKLGLA
tara:strand:- start:46 stop:282 length:237 start_codon:yes stop_codon:yes gene_type:complete